jgi:Rieske Fe-S protein
MAESSVPSSRRRTLLAGAGAACAATLAGCARYNSNNGINAAPSAASSSAPAGSGTGAAPASSAGPAVLTTTSQVPVGGGEILTGQKIVVTQPQAGTFKAFSAVCTHQGCIVDAVANGTIDCPCHGSQYSITTGDVVSGPAPRPLPAKVIKVSGSSVFLE